MFNRENLDEVYHLFEEKRRRADSLAQFHTEEVEGKNATLKKIGKQMRSIGLRVLEESMRGGEDLPVRLEKIQQENKHLQEEYRKILTSMGYPEDYTKPRRDCKRCSDAGFVDGIMCPCMKREVVLAGYKSSGIGKLLEKQTFDRFDLSYYSTALLPDKRYSPRDIMKEILEFCRGYAASFSPSSPSLLFIGGTGLGKTHLSSAIAGEVIQKGYDVVYCSAPQIAAVFEKERFQQEENSEGTQRLFEAELLILDDLGTEPSSKVTSSAIYQLINHRVAVSGKPTIISTNLSYRQLEKQYDTAILSRLLGEFQVKFFQGEDIRMAKLR